MAESSTAEAIDESTAAGPGGRIWSGTVSFGLVSIPVNLVAGTRSQSVALRMLSKDGSPLQRRYACSKEDKKIDYDDIVRGYDTGGGKFVVVSDEELESLAPERSRDIDLRHFVDLAEVDPIFFDHPYYLVPSGGSTKAYRLLAETMEKTRQAGIATFVMRGKEYLIAILAENGLLRAETMRFADEIRSAESVGLPKPEKVGKREAAAVEKLIAKHAASKLDPTDLIDERNRRLLQLIAKKEEEGRDLLEGEVEPESGDDKVINLMEKLKQSLSQRPSSRGPKRHGTPRKRKAA